MAVYKLFMTFPSVVRAPRPFPNNVAESLQFRGEQSHVTAAQLDALENLM